MVQRLMTEDEKVAIAMEAEKFWEQGRIDEARALEKSMPLPAYLAKMLKEKVGVDFLVQGGWNLAEAEAEYGQGWINR
jgi:hypothetical protein